VVTVNVALVCPAAIVTVVGTDAKVPLLVKPTVAPPVGAGVARVTVPVDEVPPTTEVGLSVNEERTGTVIVSPAETDFPPAVAVIVTFVSADTARVVTVKVAVV